MSIAGKVVAITLPGVLFLLLLLPILMAIRCNPPPGFAALFLLRPVLRLPL